MQTTTKKLPHSALELTIELTVEEMQPFLERGATRLATEKPIEGFRAGKAPLEIVIQKFGAMPVMQAGAEEAVRATFPKALMQEKVLSIGSPSIEVQKMAPGNPFIYTATVTLLPEVTLGAFAKLTIAKKEVLVPDAEVQRALKDLRVLRATEAVTSRGAEGNDKVVIDMDMKLNGVPLEGGQAKGHQVYLDEPAYIPGLTDALKGLKKGDTKTFTLAFPLEHYQKNVAGKAVEFSVTVTDVFERTLPVLDEVFAQTLGQKTVADLEKIIHENLLAEAQQKEDQRQEIAMLEAIVQGSRFGDLPDLLVNEEVGRMFAELREGIHQRGMDWNQYLESTKKSETQMKLDFAPQAVNRIKVALVVRAVALAQNIEVDDATVAAEVAREMNTYADDADRQAHIRSEEYQDRMRMVLRNRKVIEYLKKTIIK